MKNDLDSLKQLLNWLIGSNYRQGTKEQLNENGSDRGNQLPKTVYQWFCQTTTEQPKGTVFDVQNDHYTSFSVKGNGCLTSKTAMTKQPFSEYWFINAESYGQRMINAVETAIDKGNDAVDTESVKTTKVVKTKNAVKTTDTVNTETVKQTTNVVNVESTKQTSNDVTTTRFFGYDTTIADETKRKRIIQASMNEFGFDE